MSTKDLYEDDPQDVAREDEVLLDPDSDFDSLKDVKRVTWTDILFVFAGGFMGGILRQIAFTVLAKTTAMLTVNIVGSLLLGFILESIILGGEETQHGKAMRLLLGTGCMGAFTTYSTFIADVSGIIQSGFYGMAIYLSLATLLVGLASALMGIVLARAIQRERSRHA